MEVLKQFTVYLDILRPTGNRFLNSPLKNLNNLHHMMLSVELFLTVTKIHCTIIEWKLKMRLLFTIHSSTDSLTFLHLQVCDSYNSGVGVLPIPAVSPAWTTGGRGGCGSVFVGPSSPIGSTQTGQRVSIKQKWPETTAPAAELLARLSWVSTHVYLIKVSQVFFSTVLGQTWAA